MAAKGKKDGDRKPQESERNTTSGKPGHTADGPYNKNVRKSKSPVDVPHPNSRGRSDGPVRRDKNARGGK